MAHIADRYNDGRTGNHQSIDQARGAYAELIQKEARVCDAAHTRHLLELANVRCPKCGVPVATVRCHICRHFPIKLPSAKELDKLDEVYRKMRGLPKVPGSGSSSASSASSLRTPPLAVVGGSALSRSSASTVSIRSSVSQRSAHVMKRREVQKKIDSLQHELESEQKTQAQIMNKIDTLQRTLETALKEENVQK